MQLENDSDQSFSLLSLGITGFQPDTIAYTDVYMVGYQSGGGSVTRDLNSDLLDCDDCAAGPLNWSTLSFGVEWTDLTHVIFYTDTAELWLDNVVLTTVPIPAAV